VPAKKTITIVGGGLAGFALGIGLRQRSVPVTVCEAGSYPRHRVCGEFISGKGLDSLASLGLRTPFFEAGAIPANTAAFFSPRTAVPARTLPSPALCLSRFFLDAVLAREFQRLGGDLKTSTRYCENDPKPGVVWASGRRLKTTEHGWRWFGLKVHARDVPLTADLEMHLSPDAYVGLCRLQNGEVNICGLFRRRAGSHQPKLEWQEILRGDPNSILRQRLAGIDFEAGSFCSVAGLSLAPQNGANRNECCIGDALTMIPPATGNGMSMAFESAVLAIDPLAAYSRGELPWPEAQKTIAFACDKAFAQRLAWAKWFQWMLFCRALQSGLGAFALRSEWLWRILFSRTR